MIKIESVTILESERARIDAGLEQAQKDAAAVIALTHERDAANAALASAASALEIEKAARLAAQKALADSVAREQALQARIDGLTKSPTPHKITTTDLPRFAGFTIEKGRTAPSATLYNQVKTAMRWGRVQGLDTWRGFFNPQEVLDHLKDTPPLGHLPDYGRSIGYAHWIADTIDRTLELIPVDAKDPSDAKLKAHMDGLEEMGAEGVMINDANRVATATHPGITFEELKAMIARLRRVAPNMPIFVSLLGSANVDLYKALGVWVEIQTFGSISELGTFLKKPVILCLSLFKSMTAAEIKTRADLTLKTPPKWLFFYADEVTDYDAMPDSEDKEIRDFVSKWKALG